MYRFPPKQTLTANGEVIEYVVAGTGVATVVLVNGAGGPIEGWHKVFGDIAGFARIFAYNRPGIGGSAKPQLPQTGLQMVDTLRATLQAARLPPPYLLVGHSLGGLIVNLFARLHPEEIAAVVLIEATAPDDVADLALHEHAIQRWVRTLLNRIAPIDPHAETQQVQTTVSALAHAPSFPAIPLIVLTGGKPAMAWATTNDALAARTKHQQSLVKLSPQGKQWMAMRSGHFPQFTEAGLVVAAIRDATLAASASDMD
ncbi:alpha/beta hydrolase [Chitinivorax sp. B]|uniref:alpha/beta fold hydrolase n=1 Tax=Chitinivorax sp. B TaxID=2502235 RepID=UPI0010F748AA|nr:alpha/beta hydrolase [Chitinivorax sp. B]